MYGVAGKSWMRVGALSDDASIGNDGEGISNSRKHDCTSWHFGSECGNSYRPLELYTAEYHHTGQGRVKTHATQATYLDGVSVCLA